MARATVTKRFELSLEAAKEIEWRAKVAGLSQTALVERTFAPVGGYAEQDNGTTTRQVESPERTPDSIGQSEIELSREDWARIAAVDRHDQAELPDTPMSTFNSPDVAKNKAERKERKGKLAESVKEALPPAGVNSERIVEQQPGTYCPKHRPKYCEPDCPHRVTA